MQHINSLPFNIQLIRPLERIRVDSHAPHSERRAEFVAVVLRDGDELVWTQGTRVLYDWLGAGTLLTLSSMSGKVRGWTDLLGS